MMAPKRLKTGTRRAYRRHFSNQPFQRFTAIADTLTMALALALWGSRRYISPTFPDKACGGVLYRLRVVQSENRVPLFGITRYARGRIQA
jgi:hypothetical protein